MKKRTYRKIAVKEVDVVAVATELGVGRAVFAIDVAKVDMVAAVVAGDGRVVRRFVGRIRRKTAWYWSCCAGFGVPVCRSRR